MLIRYKKSMEKIAMGLLSFMPKQKDVKKLQHTIQEYADNENWHLYLWRQNDDILGAIGLKITDQMSAIIQHISVDPSHRNLGIGKSMVKEVKKRYESEYEVLANKYIQTFFTKCLEDEIESE